MDTCNTKNSKKQKLISYAGKKQKMIAYAAILNFIVAVHDKWSYGSEIPPWVKAWCCGPNDAHRDVQLERRGNDVFVKGLKLAVDSEKIFGSQDGHV